MGATRIQDEHLRAHADQQQLMPSQPKAGLEAVVELIKPQQALKQKRPPCHVPGSCPEHVTEGV